MHLLKQCSKPQPATRKKKKYGIIGSLEEFKAQKAAQELNEALQIDPPSESNVEGS